MLKLSTKGQYGVRAMFEIARGYPTTPTTIKDIAKRQDVSVAYLEQILNTLRRAGLISSVRGPGGGYLLSKEPARTSIGAILKTLEGPVAITSCLDPQEGCSRIDGCVTYLLWKSLGEKIEAFLDTITLGDLLKEGARPPAGKGATATPKKGSRTPAKKGSRTPAKKGSRTPAGKGSRTPAKRGLGPRRAVR